MIAIPFPVAVAVALFMQSQVGWVAELKRDALASKTRYAWGTAKSRASARKKVSHKPWKEPRSMLQRALATPLALRTIGFGSDPTPYVWDGKHTFRVATPEEVRAMNEWETRDYREDVTALNLARNDDLIGARSELEQILGRRPGDDTAAEYLGDVCLRMGIYEEALAVLAPELSQFSTRDVLLRAALAGAMTGKGYPGQAAFTNQFIAWNREIYTRPEVVATAATDLASIQLSALKAIASWVARGKEQAQEQLYFERARALDPEDAVVEYELGGLYSGALRLEDAKAAYEIAAEHGTGEIRMLAELDVQWLDGQIKAMARADSHLVKPP